MRPSLRQLEYAVAVADTLHFREAAESCYVSQPGLSAQLKRLEEQPIDDLLPEYDRTACRIEPPGRGLESPEDIVAQGRMRDLIRRKIGELPESYRIVLMLRDIEEIETAEVAKMLEISESNVKVRLHRARSALKKLLEPLLRGEPS